MELVRDGAQLRLCFYVILQALTSSFSEWANPTDSGGPSCEVQVQREALVVDP